MNTKKRYIIFASVILLAFIIAWGGYSIRSQFSHYQKQMLKFDLSKQAFTKKIDNQGRQIVQQEQIILTHKQAIKHGLLEVDRLRKIKSQIRVISKTQLDSVFVPFTLTETDSFFISDTINAISVPKKFELTNEWYALAGTIHKTGVLIDSVSFINDMRVTIGFKKQPLVKRVFSTPIPIVDIQNNNPYTQILDMNNVIIKQNKKFYNKKTFWFSIGVVATLLITK